MAPPVRRKGSTGTGPNVRYKRPFDLLVLGLGLIVLLPVWPVLAAAVALAIRISGPGPVLYRQVRLGREGREFQILKFRTMAPDAEERTGPVWATWNDARATPVGRVLRQFHLDELPQVVNVLRGEMSLVGPRPERPELAARIEPAVPGFSRRLRVRPGIAGLAQARGGSGIRPRDKLRYDRCYIEAMGPWLDLRLCVLCVCKALRPGVDLLQAASLLMGSAGELIGRTAPVIATAKADGLRQWAKRTAFGVIVLAAGCSLFTEPQPDVITSRQAAAIIHKYALAAPLYHTAWRDNGRDH